MAPPATIVFVSEAGTNAGLPPKLLAIPAPFGASFKYSVSLNNVTVPKLAKPPPLVVATLLDSVLLVRSSEPKLFQSRRRLPTAELSLNVLAVIALTAGRSCNVTATPLLWAAAAVPLTPRITVNELPRPRRDQHRLAADEDQGWNPLPETGWRDQHHRRGRSGEGAVELSGRRYGCC